jgi:ribosomal protein L22
MSPKREIDETKGANPDEKVAEEAKQAKAEKPKSKAKAQKAKAEDAKAAKAEPKKAAAKKKPDEPKAEEPKEEPKPKAAPVADMRVRAKARYVRSSARKARLVCDHIRGKSVPEARAILEYAPRAVARDWSKVLESAVANAENNHELVGDELRVAEAFADEGPTLKRFRPRAMGRATSIHKRTSHLSITLTPSATKE